MENLPNYLQPGTLGGIMLIVGAYALYRGSLLWSVGLYFFADIMWVILAYKQGDVFGVFAISTGMFLGLLVWVKMHRNEFVKDVRKKKDIE